MKSACLIAAEADVLAFIGVDSMQKLACWVSDAQVAEIGYTAFTSKKKQAVTAWLTCTAISHNLLRAVGAPWPVSPAPEPAVPRCVATSSTSPPGSSATAGAESPCTYPKGGTARPSG